MTADKPLMCEHRGCAWHSPFPSLYHVSMELWNHELRCLLSKGAFTAQEPTKISKFVQNSLLSVAHTNVTFLKLLLLKSRKGHSRSLTRRYWVGYFPMIINFLGVTPLEYKNHVDPCFPLSRAGLIHPTYHNYTTFALTAKPPIRHASG